MHDRLARPVAKFLSRKLKEAIKGAAESKLAFDNLNKTAQPDMVILWKEEEVITHANRAEDPAAMDIYEVRSDHMVVQLQQENSRSCTCCRLKIALTIWSSTPPVDEELPLGSQPDKLHTQITRFLEMAPTYLGGDVDVNDSDFSVIVCNSLDDNYEDYSDFDEDQNPGPDICDASIFQLELTVIPLPSNIGEVRCRELGLTNLMKEEIAL
ncbi:hypothetical protein BDR04DRAFT_1155434 [Suillus decipiens]|nr:hypothetical protein BDR04DRAFT_1155434 [Suillus decipiens]